MRPEFSPGLRPFALLGGGTLGARLARLAELPFRVLEDEGDGHVDLVAGDVAQSYFRTTISGSAS